MDKTKYLHSILLQLEQDAFRLPLAGKPELTVPAEGSPEAKIFFIGEAAGYHELKHRRPFVGVAGQLLTATLEANKIARRDAWISNIIKARPPENRDPLPEEIATYRPYLDSELAVIRPQLVVTLGRFSMYKFLGDTVRISQIHGQPRWVNFTPATDRLLPSELSVPLRFVLLPMYHPAAALRSTAVRKMFEEDFKKIPQLLIKLARTEEESGKIETDQPKQTDVKDNEQLSLI